MIKKSVSFGAVIAVALSLVMVASAATTVVVTPTNQQGWSTADTRPGGQVNFVADATSPFPNGALQLKTDLTTTAKAQYLHGGSGPLSAVTELSYFTRQVSGPPIADPAYQLIVDLNGAAAGGFTTLVYEPYQNGVIVPNVWQQWDVDAGLFWSTRTFTDGTCVIAGTPGGPATYNLNTIKTLCPNATVLGYGVNVGTNNPGYNVYTDGFNFNGTVYDFELKTTPTSKNDCKNGGFVNFFDNNDKPFKNQGQCVKSVENQNDNNDENEIEDQEESEDDEENNDNDD